MTLARTTPTAIAEAVYQDGRARRFPPVNGIPDARAAFKPEADRDRIREISRLAFRAHLDDVAPTAWRVQVGEQLLADVDRRYPPADMALLARYGLTERKAVMTVEVAGGPPVRFPLMGDWRDLPRVGHAPMTFSAVPATVTDRVVAPPPATMPLFDAIAAAHAIRFAEFDEIWVWPVRFKHEQKRNPTWGEIEAAWPRVGAWMAQKRSA